MELKVTPLALPEALLIEYKRLEDARGFFTETYRESDFSALGLPRFVQENHSRSAKGVLRGLHYQLKPAAQGKLVRCLRGKVFDVCADIRKGSPRYARWAAVELSESRPALLYVPPGFVHGFAALSDGAEVLYKVSSYYSPAHERSLLWSDPELGIEWPLREPVLSPKDAAAPRLQDADNDFAYPA